MLQYADECSTTLATICLASFCTFLYELVNCWVDDIGIAYTMASRPVEPEAAELVGPFMYYQLLRMHLENGPHTTFQEFVHWVRSVVISGLEHVRAMYNPLEIRAHDQLSSSSTSSTSLPQEMCPCVVVQFDLEDINHVILDEGADHAKLDIVRNESDGFLQDAWWRVATNDCWITQFYYNPEAKELGCIPIFPTTLFKRATAFLKLGDNFSGSST
ncbi:hypothetical protein I4U23_000031 [Adineta vaga]|nr:hypothetical protein I4U23_000031 [Adineta vaga]